MRIFALLATILFSCCLSAVAEVESASGHNSALAPSLLGAANPCNEEEGAIGEGNLISLAGMRPVALIPEVDGATTDSAGASLLWSYYASYPKSAIFPIDGGKCPDGTVEYYGPAAPALADGILKYEYGDGNRAVPLSSLGPNPVPLDLGIAKIPEGSLRVPLRISLSGTVAATYSYLKNYYRYYEQSFGEGAGWGCSLETERGVRTFEKRVFGEKNFSVEAGKCDWFWLNPPLASRLEGMGKGELALFARRLPAALSVKSEGKEIASATPYRFILSDGECGEEKVSREFAPQGSLIVNASNRSLAPLQLVSDNLTYLPFYLEFGWLEGAGKKEIALDSVDAFGKSERLARNFSVRRPSPFSGAQQEGGAVSTRNAGESVTAASFPAAPSQQESMPGLSPLAMLAAFPFALWAYALLRRKD